MNETSIPSLPDDASLFTRLRVASQCLGVLKRDPTNPAYGQLFNLSLNGGLYTALARELRRSGDGLRMMSERPSLQRQDMDLEALERLSTLR